MTRVLIIGASKGIGLEATRQALEAGHHVRVLARSATGMAPSHPDLAKVSGDALKSEGVEAARIVVHVVMRILGVRVADVLRPLHSVSNTTQILVAAMMTKGVKHLISVTRFGACVYITTTERDHLAVEGRRIPGPTDRASDLRSPGARAGQLIF